MTMMADETYISLFIVNATEKRRINWTLKIVYQMDSLPEVCDRFYFWRLQTQPSAQYSIYAAKKTQEA